MLEYSIILNSFDDIKKINQIVFNNEWLDKYNKVSFFNIIDGIPKSNYYYGENKSLLTLELADKITEYLTLNNIPLNYLLVNIAFRKYFNGELDNFIASLHELDSIINKSENKKRIKTKKGD